MDGWRKVLTNCFLVSLSIHLTPVSKPSVRIAKDRLSSVICRALFLCLTLIKIHGVII